MTYKQHYSKYNRICFFQSARTKIVFSTINSQSAQAVVESLFILPLVFLFFFCAIEIIRFQVFKANSAVALQSLLATFSNELENVNSIHEVFGGKRKANLEFQLKSYLSKKSLLIKQDDLAIVFGFREQREFKKRTFHLNCTLCLKSLIFSGVDKFFAFTLDEGRRNCIGEFQSTKLLSFKLKQEFFHTIELPILNIDSAKTHTMKKNLADTLLNLWIDENAKNQ